jgi:hypothetical protein
MERYSEAVLKGRSSKEIEYYIYTISKGNPDLVTEFASKITILLSSYFPVDRWQAARYIDAFNKLNFVTDVRSEFKKGIDKSLTITRERIAINFAGNKAKKFASAMNKPWYDIGAIKMTFDINVDEFIAMNSLEAARERLTDPNSNVAPEGETPDRSSKNLYSFALPLMLPFILPAVIIANEYVIMAVLVIIAGVVTKQIINLVRNRKISKSDTKTDSKAEEQAAAEKAKTEPADKQAAEAKLAEEQRLKAASEAEAAKSAEEKKAEKKDILIENNFEITSKTMSMTAENINTVIERFKAFNIDPKQSEIEKIPEWLIIDVLKDKSNLEAIKNYLESKSLEFTIDNIVNLPTGALVMKNLYDSLRVIRASLMLWTELGKWISSNISEEKRQETQRNISDSLQIFVEGEEVSEETKKEASSMMSDKVGLNVAILQRVYNKPSNYKNLMPNTVVKVSHYDGKTYKTYDVIVRHSIPADNTYDGVLFKKEPVIKTNVIENEELNNDIADAQIRKKIYDQVYYASAKHFADDIKGNRDVKRELGISGVGMIDYKYDPVAGTILDGNVIVEEKANIGVLELKTADEKAKYFADGKIKIDEIGNFMSAIASREVMGKEDQMPGREDGITMNADISDGLANEVKVSRQMANEKSKNISIARVSSSSIKETIESLWNERNGGKPSLSEGAKKIRNVLNADKDIKKVVDLKPSDLLKDGRINTDLIKQAYEIGFNGIYADVSGFSSEEVREVISTIRKMSRRYGLDTHNYMIFDRDNVKNNAKLIAANEKLLSDAAITAVVRVKGKGKSMNAKIERAVGSLTNVALEMDSMESGEELERVQGKIVTLFLNNTSKLSKDTSRISKIKSVLKIFNSIYNSALSSDYILNIDPKNIKFLKAYMSVVDGETVDFEGMIKALDDAGIAKDSVLYQYVLNRSENNTAESFASAKAHLRASVENYLEREYVKTLGTGTETETMKQTYFKKVDVSDRNAIRALLIYMAVNGEDAINETAIKDILAAQRVLLSGEDKNIAELRADMNELINEIMDDPINASPSKIDDAKKAFTVLNDMVATFASLDNMLNNAKNSALMSASAVKGFLTAA